MARSRKPLLAGSLDGWSGRPALVLVSRSKAGMAWLQERLSGLAEGEPGDAVALEEHSEVSLEGVAHFELRVDDVAPEIAIAGDEKDGFTWTCDSDGWETLASLLEPFAVGQSGHQYLHHAFGAPGEIDVVISSGEGKESRAGSKKAKKDEAPKEEKADDEMADVIAEVQSAVETARVIKDTPKVPVESMEPAAPMELVVPVEKGVPLAPVEPMDNEEEEPMVVEIAAQTSAEEALTGVTVFGVTIPTTDLERARRFYESALGCEAEDGVPGRLYFSPGGARLMVIAGEAGDGFHPNTHDLYIATDHIEETHAAVADSEGEVRSGIGASWSGERSFTCSDPDGNPICFVDAGSVR